MGIEDARPDAALAAIAARQHGVVTVHQLHEAGLGKKAVHDRAARGWLHPVHRGVYAVGHPGLSREGRWMAAVLACTTTGRPAFLSHRNAAALWGLLEADPTPIDVVVPRYGGRLRRSGIRLHRSEIRSAADTASRWSVPATTPARTIFDLERSPRRFRPSPTELRRAVRQAGVHGYDLGSAAEWDGTKSELEARFLRFCRKYRLPLPKTNSRVAGMEVDFLWREAALVVETDGFRFHRGRVAFEDDRRRDLRLHGAGYDVLRITRRQLAEEPGEIAAAVRRRLNSPRLAS